MPKLSTVEQFVALVESGHTLQAMERYYADHATMQENAAPPRIGKPALIAHEVAALATVSQLQARCIRPILITGDVVVIRWWFEIHNLAGQAMRFEELAYQRWEAELIVQEQFFYDPGQFRQAADAPALAGS